MPTILLSTEDSAQTTLNGGINASVLTIAVVDGSVFPQPYTGTASSSGSSTVLNDTGDLGNVAVGDIVRNVTDGSWAVCTVAGTNSITTTRLQGGTDNLWDSGDTWRVGEFVITIDDGDANGESVTAREKILISNRSGNNLTVPTGGRGYDGSSGQTWTTGQYVRLNVTSVITENVIDGIADMAKWNNTNQTSIETHTTELDAVRDNTPFYATSGGSSNAYTLTVTPAQAAYVAGQRFEFKANHANTGAATLNVSSLGAKTIKKKDGATDVASGDIQNGQVVQVIYDGTNMQMISPLGQVTEANVLVKYISTADSNRAGQSSTSAVDIDQNYTIPTADLNVTGVHYLMKSQGFCRQESAAATTLELKLGTTTIATVSLPNTGADKEYWLEGGFTVRTTGASGTVMPSLRVCVGSNSADDTDTVIDADNTAVTVDLTADRAFKLTVTYATNNASNGIISKQLTVTRYKV